MKWPSIGNVLLGLWLISAPVVLHYGGAPATNDVIMGVVVGAIALGSIVLLPELTATSWVNLFCGIWIVFAPVIFGFAQLRSVATTHVAVGLLITILAAIRAAAKPRVPTRAA